jgi:riboflavin transporter
MKKIITIKLFNAKTIGLSQLINSLLYLSIIGACILIPQLSQNQFITGSIINTLLLSTVIMFGTSHAVIAASIPSFFAYTFGIIPPILTPFIPFIITANIIYITSFNLFYKRKQIIIGSLFSSTSKALFLFSILNLFILINPDMNIPSKLFQIMGLNQLITALIGCIIVNIIRKR